MQASHYSRETFVQVSHNIRANFNQLYFSQLSLEMVLFVRIFVALRIVCEGLGTGSPRANEICDDLVVVLR